MQRCDSTRTHLTNAEVIQLLETARQRPGCYGFSTQRGMSRGSDGSRGHRPKRW
jgi:hypothetical protein